MRIEAAVVRGALAALGLLAACGSPPRAVAEDAAPDGFDWSIDLTLPDDALLSAWVAPPGGAVRALAVGGRTTRGLVIEWSEQTWRAPVLPAGTPLLWWVWGGPDGEAVAVGEGATILRRIDGAWRRDPADGIDPRYTLFGVWDVWAVGGSFEPGMSNPGVIARWDGAAWRVVASADKPLLKVWGAGASDVWAVGEAGTILHYDGDGWTSVASSTTVRLVAVSGRATDEVYAVGGVVGGVVLRWDGTTWSHFADTPEALSGVWTAPGRALYVGGNRGYLARFGADDDDDPEPGQMTATVAIDGVDFHAVAGADVVVAVGADLLSAGTGEWRGTLGSHGQPALAGSLVIDQSSDAGPADAGPVDATPADAALEDATVGDPDAHWPAEGEACGFDPETGAYCAAALACWYLTITDTTICTEGCASAGDCTAYGASACCRRPGPQTLRTVCIPDSFVECD